MIRLEHISKVYAPDFNALRDVNLHIEEGEFVAIMGRSGSGKSTLMNLIGCLDKPSYGNILYDSLNVAQMSADQVADIRLRRIGFVFQNFNLLPKFAVWKNVALPMAYARVPRQVRKQKAVALLSQLGLVDKDQCLPGQLSGGEQQRVSIARALANNPQIIIADEPTGNLDSHNCENIMRQFCTLHENGKTILLVTHDENVASFATRVLVVKDGVLNA